MEDYPVRDLWQAHNAKYSLWALCRECGHVARLDPYDLIKKSRDGELKDRVHLIKTKMESLQRELNEVLGQKAANDEYKKLLYASDAELEQIFARALRACGGKILPAKYSQEEFILEHDCRQALVECKGVGKSIALTHLRQLFDYMLRSEEEEGAALKGILLGNAWRNLPPDERAGNDKPIFPKNVVDRAKQVGVALVNSADFFKVLGRVLVGEVSGHLVLKLIMETDGPVDFSGIS